MTQVRLVTTKALFLLLATLSLTANAEGVTVATLDGERGGLGGHLVKDKVNVVMVWTTYCGVCRGQYPLISKFHDQYKEGDAVVLGISLDGFDATEKVRSYRTEQRHSFPSVISESEQFAELYEKTTGEDFTGTPTYLVFNKEGGLIAYLDGPISQKGLDKLMAN